MARVIGRDDAEARALLEAVGVRLHAADAATMYPSLAANTVVSKTLGDLIAAGRLGMKTGAGFYDWTPETIAGERARYEALLRAGLALLEPELPKVDPG